MNPSAKISGSRLRQGFGGQAREGGAEGGGEGEESRRARALGWEMARPCISKEAKPAKIDSLIVRQLADCARPLKDLSIFEGFAGRCQAASRWAGCRAAGAALKVSVRIFAEKGSDFVQYAEYDGTSIV